MPDLFRASRPTGRPARPEEVVRSRIEDDNAGIFVAEVRDGLVGLAEFRIVETPERPFMASRRFVFVDGLIVRQQHRRQGIGRALMAQVHRLARHRGIARVELGVYEFNTAALGFYEDLGYETIYRGLKADLS